MKMFNIPNLFTAGNMLCGVAAILLTFAGQISIAPYFIFAAAILDFFDGFLARILKQQGELGKQLDSLADMISFGLAPGVMMMYVLLYANGPYAMLDETNTPTLDVTFNAWIKQIITWDHPNLLPLCGLIIPFFSLFRLAKFNIDTRQSESFIGLPTPANTIFFMSFPLLIVHSTGPFMTWQYELINWLIQPAVLIPIIVIMSLLLVSELPLFALKFKTFKWKGNEIRFIFLISCGILIPLLLFWSVPIIILLYLLLSLINNIIRKKQTHEIQS